ncbi:hypothetical protein CHN56_00067 [Bacillus velezensis]|uniref:hypothetical protein n=1 Tax=Bacillus velezensis TaxID=492670 RepID=UPI000B927847|nr:hypothetical protein [Bacillus velezensis]ASS60612.1 hypothetical protein CHN56_00067 [Bacillus velezensis]ATC49409.1 hypothetical protein CLI97_00072 [Bacillus velezensis]
MKVKYSHSEGNFAFAKGDYVTVVVRYLYVKSLEDELYYHGTVTEIDEQGFRCVLDDDKTKEEYFSFLDVENVIDGDRIPFFAGTTKRIKGKD